MSEIKRCALLDTDFISKLYITKASDSDRLIYRILSIADFHFACHKQTSIELARHNQWASKCDPKWCFSFGEMILLQYSYGVVTINGGIDFLRSALPEDPLYAKASIVKPSRRFTTTGGLLFLWSYVPGTAGRIRHPPASNPDLPTARTQLQA